MNGYSATLPAHSETSPVERVGELFEAHHDRLYRLARRLTSSQDDAMDLVQETFLRAARSPGSLPRNPVEEEAWLVRVLVNLRRDQWRRESVRRRHHLAQPLTERLSSSSLEQDLITRDAVAAALDLLPPRRRSIVVMHELEGLSVSSIASLLGLRPITVRWHLSAGRKQLACTLRCPQGD